MRIAEVQEVLAAAGVEMNARELAEVLWLATRLHTGEHSAAVMESARPSDRLHATAPFDRLDSAAPPAGVPRSRDPETPAAPAPVRPSAHLPYSTPRAPLYRRERPAAAGDGIAVKPIQVRSAAAVQHNLELLRALRVFKRTVPSTREFELDEEATVRRIAERGMWVPALKLADDRWLDVMLVIEAGPSGVWDRTGVELSALLRRVGAFRDVRLRYLHEDAAGTPWVAAQRQRAGAKLRSPAELTDPTRRRLILVLSDCTSRLWRSGRAADLLDRWAQSGPVAILQPLPERLWSRTSAPPARVRLRSSSPGASNDRLRLVGYGRSGRALAGRPVVVPMLEIDASWIGPWAILVAHSTEGGIDAAVAVVGRHGRPTRAPTASADLSPRERIMQLRAESSPEAYRLASYLAAAPLTLPVMRTVQAAMMPTSTPAHLAEILFSGILTTVDGSADASPDECLYEFVDGIRDVLLGTLRRHEAVQVIDAVSDFVEQRIHQPGAGLPAVIASPQGKESISAVSRPFAGIRADVLLRAQQGPAIGAAAGFSHSIGVHDGPPTCTVATVLSKQNTPVGEAVLVDARYFATCAHVINAATDRPPQEPSWPEEAVVRLRIPVRGTVVDVDATIAVWRPYRVNFVDMDLAILRVDDLQLGPIFPAALASVSSAGDVLIEARDDVVVSGELGTDRVSLTLDPGFTGEIVSGARVWKMPGAEELAGIVQSPHDLGSALEVYRIVPALLIRETLTGYLGRGAGSVSVRPGAHAVTAEEDQSGRLEPEPAGTHQAVEDIETTAELPPMSDGLADTAGFSPDFTTSGTGLEDPRAKAAMEVTSPDDGQRYTRKWNRRGYKVDEVDGYVKVIEQTLADYASGAVVGRPLVTSQDVHDSIFRVRFGGYDEWEVDLYLDRAERQLAEHEDRNSFPKDWTG